MFVLLFFLWNNTPITDIYTLSLHDALPILVSQRLVARTSRHGLSDRHETAAVILDAETFRASEVVAATQAATPGAVGRSEEHTSELQSHVNLVCRLLLEKKKNNVNVTMSEL